MKSVVAPFVVAVVLALAGAGFWLAGQTETRLADAHKRHVRAGELHDLAVVGLGVLSLGVHTGHHPLEAAFIKLVHQASLEHMFEYR